MTDRDHTPATAPNIGERTMTETALTSFVQSIMSEAHCRIPSDTTNGDVAHLFDRLAAEAKGASEAWGEAKLAARLDQWAASRWPTHPSGGAS